MFSMPASFDDISMQQHTQPNKTPTEGTMSVNGSHGVGGESVERDPFLSLLEQLAENEQSSGGPSELGFFLNGGGQRGSVDFG